MNYELKVTAANADEMKAAIRNLFEGLSVPQIAPNNLDHEPLNELVDRTRRALEEAGFRMEVTQTNQTGIKHPDKVSPGMAQATPEPETQPETPEVPKQSKKQVEALKRLAEGATPDTVIEDKPEVNAKMSPETMKAACLEALKELYKKDPKRVNAMLKQYGDGEKRFTNIDPGKFKPIAVELGIA